MTFIDYIKSNYPDPDALICKPVHEALDEIIKFHKEYLTEIVKKVKLPQNFYTCDFNNGVESSIDKIKQS